MIFRALRSRLTFAPKWARFLAIEFGTPHYGVKKRLLINIVAVALGAGFHGYALTSHYRVGGFLPRVELTNIPTLAPRSCRVSLVVRPNRLDDIAASLLIRRCGTSAGLTPNNRGLLRCPTSVHATIDIFNGTSKGQCPTCLPKWSKNVQSGTFQNAPNTKMCLNAQRPDSPLDQIDSFHHGGGHKCAITPYYPPRGNT